MWEDTDKFFARLDKLGTFQVEDLESCPQCSAKGERSLTGITIPLTTEPKEYLLNETQAFGSTEVCCVNLDVMNCKGVQMQSMIQMTKDEQPLWLMVRNSGSLQGPEKFLDFPKELKVSAEKFQLASISLYDDVRKHFTNLMHVNGEFFYYDGMLGMKNELPQRSGKKDSRLRVVSKGDYMGNQITVDHVLYLRCIGGEEI